MSRKSKRKVWVVDAETDPFKHGRFPKPFIWGAYDGSQFLVFYDTKSFVEWMAEEHAFIYAHNGGKFDFMFLLPFIHEYMGENEFKCKIINGRIAEMPFGKAKMRDSWSIIPTPLKDFQKDDFDYSKMEADVRHKHMPEIIRYLKSDCVNLYQIVDTFRLTAGKGLTIAGNALSFARSLDINVGRSNRRFDKKFRPFYYGGRCQALQPGIHQACDFFDIKSAYPFAMKENHASGTEYIDRAEVFNRLSDDRLKNCFIVLTCDSEGAFPIKSRSDLSFPIGRGTFYVTGWEFVTAKKHNLISGAQIHHCYEFYGEVSFADYVDHWFASKEEAEKAGDKPLRHVCKIMLNSLYGKLCQNPIRYMDYKFVPALTEPDVSEGWSLAAQGKDYEIHKKPSLHKLYEKYGEDWESFPVFYNVATGASITGFCRAMLLDAIHRAGRENSLYCDTDSLILRSGAGNALDRGEYLGQWGWEGFAPRVYIAGRKQYGAKLSRGPKKGIKLASKGANLNLSQIKKLCKGATIRYEHDAPTFKLDGRAEFITRAIKATGVTQ